MVFGHLSYAGDFSNYFEVIKKIIYTFHMPVFYIISGMFSSSNNFNDAMIKLWSKIVIPFYVFYTLYIITLSIMSNFINGFHTEAPSSLFELMYILFISPVGSFWFLYDMMIMSLLMIICTCIKIPNYLRSFYLIYTLLLFYAVSYMDVINFKSALYFITGHLICRYNIYRILGNKLFLFFNLIVILLFLFFTGEFDIFRSQIQEWIWCIFVFSFLLTILNYMPLDGWYCRILTFLGRNTMIILVLHVYFINLAKVFSGYFVLTDSSGLLYVIFSVCFSISMSIFSGRIIDKVSLSKLIFKHDLVVK